MDTVISNKKVTLWISKQLSSGFGRYYKSASGGQLGNRKD